MDERLLEYLRRRQVLLVLDNTEHLVAAAAPMAAQVLELAQRLALPDPAHLPDLSQLTEIPAVALFVERAREAAPAFALTTDNAAAIVQICLRLDGLPLALELAAARLSLLTPAALLARLERCLPLLTRGARDLPQRQQTLRTTIAWSYDLLQAGEQQLFRRLAVFVGGFTLEAVQAVCLPNATGASSSAQADEGAALEQLAQLLDKSLVQVQQGTSAEPRFSMLETIREYATEQLVASGEEAAVQERHAHYFLRLAEVAGSQLYSPERGNWRERLEPEDANLRAALSWSKGKQDAVEIGLRLAGALAWYWFWDGSLREGRTWLEETLARTGSSDRSAARGRALYGAALLAWFGGDFAAASLHAQEALSIGREAGDKHWTAYLVTLLGLVRLGRNIKAALPLVEEGHSLFKELGDAWGEAFTLYNLGSAAYRSGDLATGRAHYEESLRLFQEQGDMFYATVVLGALAVTVSTQGDQQLARSLYQQSLPLMQQARNRGTLGLFLINLGDFWLHFRDEQQAQVYYRQGLNLWQDLQRVEQGMGIVKGLAGLAEVATAKGQTERAGRLFGATDRLLPSTSFYRDEVNKRVAAARTRLDVAAFEAGWTAGQTMTQEQAITEALQDV